MATPYDAIIIGAGIIGSCTAFEMAKRGWKTLNVDKLPAAGYGSTSFSSAIIRTHYSTLEGTALAYEGYFHWRDWEKYIGVEDERGFAKMRHTGCLVMNADENPQVGTWTALSDELGIPWEDWRAEEIVKKLPFIDLTCYGPPKCLDDPHFCEPTGGTIQGAVYFPIAGYMNDPQLAAHNAQVAAESAGAHFRFNAEVTDIRKAGGRVVGITFADGKEIDAPVVINIGGPHSSKINRMAGVDDKMALSTRALREEVAYVPGVPDVDFENNGPIMTDEDAGSYVRPEIGNHLVIGGLNCSCDSEEWVDPDDFNDSLTDQAQVQLMRMAQRMPTLGIPGHLSGIVACYDVSPDWIPIYDKTDLAGYYLAIGTSGNQFKNAPVAGALMATLIEACEQGRDHDADPVTFHLENLNRDINIGFFSRNRKINQDSSFSVLG